MPRIIVSLALALVLVSWSAAPALANGIGSPCLADAECDDGNPCNGAETCPAGLCEAGSDAAAGTLCADGLFCNGSEVCDGAGQCVGAAVDVDDGVACTLDVCDEGLDLDDGLGAITHTPSDAACQDGLFCNGAETCDPSAPAANGAGCVRGRAALDDGVDCTIDRCVEGANTTDNLGTISHSAVDSVCDDGNACSADTCDVASGCVHSALGCDVDGACFPDGAPHPSNPCAWCVVSANAHGWSAQAAGTACAVPRCDGARAIGAGACDATGICVLPVPVDCLNGCAGGLCSPPCEVDTDCPGGSWCDAAAAGLCVDTNRAPAADAGLDQSVDERATVTLDGRGSADPDGDALFFAWQQTGGPSVALSGADAATASFTAPRVQEGTLLLSFELVVSDGLLESAPALVAVQVANATGNAAPVAVIEGPSEAAPGAALALSGASSEDADGDPLRFAWSQDEGPAAVLGATDADTLLLQLPEAPGESVVIGLIVHDGSLGSALTQHTIVLAGSPAVDVEPTEDAASEADTAPPHDADVAEEVDAGIAVPRIKGGGGCGCQLVGRRGEHALLALLGLCAAAWRARRRTGAVG